MKEKINQDKSLRHLGWLLATFQRWTGAHLASHFPRNIVATVNLGIRLDLKTIAMHARNAEYNPKVCFVLKALTPSDVWLKTLDLASVNSVSLPSSCVFVTPRPPL